jgi:hypothetical protein
MEPPAGRRESPAPILKTYTQEDFKRWGAQGPKKRKRTRTITPAQQAALQKARRKAKRSARLANDRS